MNSKQVIRETLAMADLVARAYMADLSDSDLLLKPHASCNSINWQVGHLILSEHTHMGRIDSSFMPKLPEKFELIYAKPSTGMVNSDSTNLQLASVDQLLDKKTLMDCFQQQRQATLRLLDLQTDETLDTPTGVPYATTRSALFHLQAAHWLMHSGQWVIVRRQLGKPVVI